MAKKQINNTEKITSSCSDPSCPFHGELSVRGRKFEGVVISKHSKRVCIQFERTIFIRKFERYAKSKTKIHARLPDCLASEVNLGDYVEVTQCRKLSKIISFVVTKKIRSNEIKHSGESQ